jgi:hypothetical protein
MRTNKQTKTPNITPAALQTREAAIYLNISRMSLKRLAYKGILHPNRALGRLLWPIKQLDAFLNDPCRTCGTTIGKKGRAALR